MRYVSFMVGCNLAALAMPFSRGGQALLTSKAMFSQPNAGRKPVSKGETMRSFYPMLLCKYPSCFIGRRYHIMQVPVTLLAVLCYAKKFFKSATDHTSSIMCI